MSLSRRLVLGSSAVVLAAGLAACGGQASPQAGGPTSQAPATTAAPSPTPTPTPTPTPLIELTADTFVDAMVAAHGASQTWSFSEASVMADGQSTVSGQASGPAAGASEFALTITVPGSGPVELRLVKGVCYLKSDETTGKFVAFDPAAADSPVSVKDITDTITPTAGIDDIRAAVASVTKAGPVVTIDGVPTQPFDVVIDTTKVTGQFAEQLKADKTTPPTITYHFWFGGDGLIRKETYDLAGEQDTVTYTWGKPVDIKAPTADQILALSGE